MYLPTSIRIYQTNRKSWAVDREHMKGPDTNLFLFSEHEKDRAIRTGQTYADYHNVPLYVEGRKQVFKRSTDPKSFCGITRPA